MTIAIDFDGVFNEYAGWGDGRIPAAKPGIKEFLMHLVVDGHAPVIFTCRDRDEVWAWLKQNELDQHVIHVTNSKPIAHVYIDDRAICYRGQSWDELLNEIDNFKPYWSERDHVGIRGT